MKFRLMACLGLLFCHQSVWSAPACQSPASDQDGDGWGWENFTSCVVVDSAPSGHSNGAPVCASGESDPDGDGWGWEHGLSCRVLAVTPVNTSHNAHPVEPTSGTTYGGQNSFIVCTTSTSDPDGDGWGFESGRSCRTPTAVFPNEGGNTEINSSVPTGLRFDTSSLRRVGGKGDNWCQTWASDDSVITAMDDGEWFTSEYKYHSRLYKIHGDANTFSIGEIHNYPEFHTDGDGWFAYGVLYVNDVLYSLVSKTQTAAWAHGPFRGMKLLRSYDGGNSWHRVDKNNNDRYLARGDNARELLTDDEMFFFEDGGRFGNGKIAYPFSYASFVQSGRNHSASTDGYVYIYSPEGASSHQLLLARVPANLVGQRSVWQYFSGWVNGSATWSNNLERRQPNMEFPKRSSSGDYFGWYSWLPSVVWNEGLGLYIMVNGGTYAGYGMSNSSTDYYDKWMHNKAGSLGLWYSQNPYGPWKQFYYNESFTADNNRNLTYQPKLSPKWISADGRKMTLIWSDAMRNADGYSHSVNYKWNQMAIEILTE